MNLVYRTGRNDALTSCGPDHREQGAFGMAAKSPNAITPEIEARFWAKVDVRSANECWPWMGGKRDGSRGVITINRRSYSAPRIAWHINVGAPMSDDKNACHSCDNPNCVNPSHIWAGTQSDNIRDCVEKGRHSSKPLMFCKSGHEMTLENRRPTTGGFRCGECARIATRERMRRLRARRSA